MRYLGYGLVLIVGLVVAACSGNGAQDTLQTENAALSTQISEVRTTATFQRDVLQITLESVQLAMTQVIRQNQDISVTLQATGISGTAIAQVQPGAIVPTAPAPPVSQGSSSNPVETQEVVSGTLDTSNAVVPTETPGEPTLYNMVMAEGVGDNDCALSSVTSFPSTDTKIYVVATAANIAPGTELGSQWYLDGNLLVSPSFKPDSAINQNCIWFYAEPSDFPFTAGNYTVQLTINGTVVGQPIPFTITG